MIDSADIGLCAVVVVLLEYLLMLIGESTGDAPIQNDMIHADVFFVRYIIALCA
jgi:hypothetical protein